MEILWEKRINEINNISKKVVFSLVVQPQSTLQHLSSVKPLMFTTDKCATL